MKRSKKQKKLSAEELAVLFDNMAMVLGSGISVSDCIAMLGEEAETGALSEALKTIEEQLPEVYYLYQAMANQGRFPDYALGMVKIGETSGRLPQVLGALGDYYRREESIRKQVKSAVLTPLLLIAMITAVVVFLVVAVLPVFEDVFRQLGVDINGSSVNALAFQVGNGIMIGVVVLLLLFLAAVAFYIFTDKGKAFFKKWVETAAPTRQIVYHLDTARFMGAFTILTTSGISMEEAMSLSAETVQSKAFGEKVQSCAQLMNTGLSFEEAAKKVTLLKGMYARMLMSGMKSGTLDKALARISQLYYDTAEESIDTMIAVIEPALVSLLSLAIGAILIGILLPLIGIMSGMG